MEPWKTQGMVAICSLVPPILGELNGLSGSPSAHAVAFAFFVVPSLALSIANQRGGGTPWVGYTWPFLIGFLSVPAAVLGMMLGAPHPVDGELPSAAMTLGGFALLVGAPSGAGVAWVWTEFLRRNSRESATNDAESRTVAVSAGRDIHAQNFIVITGGENENVSGGSSQRADGATLVRSGPAIKSDREAK